jgi:hypothetical protein
VSNIIQECGGDAILSSARLSHPPSGEGYQMLEVGDFERKSVDLPGLDAKVIASHCMPVSPWRV